MKKMKLKVKRRIALFLALALCLSMLDVVAFAAEENAAEAAVEDTQETVQQEKPKVEKQTKPQAEAEKQVKPQAEPEAEKQVKPQTEEAKPQAEPEAEKQVKPQTKPETEETKAQAEPEAEEAKPQAEPEAVTAATANTGTKGTGTGTGGGCKNGPECQLTGNHRPTCPRYCTGTAGCKAQYHYKATCPENPANKVLCTGNADCKASEHEITCPKHPDYVKPCTNSSDCPAKSHDATCPKHPDNIGTCTGDKNCAAGEGEHKDNCPMKPCDECGGINGFHFYPCSVAYCYSCQAPLANGIHASDCATVDCRECGYKNDNHAPWCNKNTDKKYVNPVKVQVSIDGEVKENSSNAIDDALIPFTYNKDGKQYVLTSVKAEGSVWEYFIPGSSVENMKLAYQNLQGNMTKPQNELAKALMDGKRVDAHYELDGDGDSIADIYQARIEYKTGENGTSNEVGSEKLTFIGNKTDISVGTGYTSTFSETGTGSIKGMGPVPEEGYKFANYTMKDESGELVYTLEEVSDSEGRYLKVTSADGTVTKYSLEGYADDVDPFSVAPLNLKGGKTYTVTANFELITSETPDPEVPDPEIPDPEIPDPEIPIPTPTPVPEPTPTPTPEPTLTPTPEPAQTPEPIPTLVARTTPVITPTAVPPVDEIADATTTVADEEVPLANTQLTDESATQSEVTPIAEEEVPLASGETWALLNLILSILTAVISALLLIGYFFGKREDDKEEEEAIREYRSKEQQKELKRKGFVRTLSVLPAIVSVIVFVLTEDMSNPMVFTDRWTLWMLVFAVANVVLTVFSKKTRKDGADNNKHKAGYKTI